ncbi:MAG TPA: MupG family TIM beta-alpha barrel fold protein [Thermaerobacter sp.]
MDKPGTARSLGIAIYPGYGAEGTEVAITRLMEEAARHGYTEVFTSLHLPEAPAAATAEALARLAARARPLGLRLWADVAPPALAALGATPDDLKPLADLGLSALRVDYGYDAAAIATMSRNPYGLDVVLNASTLRSADLNRILAAGAQPERLVACHNFYPRPETGLSIWWVHHLSSALAARGIRVAAFVPSQHGRRGPLFAGLPTVERHRSVPPDRAATELLALGCIHTLFFGDPGPSTDEMDAVRAVWMGDGIPLRIRLHPDLTAVERAIVEGTVHANRMDAAEAVVRSTTSRAPAGPATAIPPRPAEPRPRGTVTVDNDRYLRYAGELQVTLRDLPPDERVNVVGWVVPDDLHLLDFLGPGARFRLVVVDGRNGG